MTPALAPALVPELAVRDWRGTRDFYCDVLGFSCLYARPEEGFAYLTLGAAHLMIDQIGAGRSFAPPPAAPPFGQGLNLQIQVPDIAPLLQGLATRAHPLVQEAEDRWYRRGDGCVGNRQFVVADPDGYLLRFFQDLGARPGTEGDHAA